MSEKIKLILYSKYTQYALLLFGVFSALIPIIGSLLKSGIESDSAYYICIAERVAEGYIPYKTIGLGYTPLYIYIMAVLQMLFTIPNGLYWPYLLLHYLLEIGIAFSIYGIVTQLGSDKKISIFCAWLYLMMSHWLQGNAVLLEAPSVFFGMLSIYMVLHFKGRSLWNELWIGAFAAGSFLCKQYGLGFLVLDLYVIIAINKQGWRHCLTFILGYILPIVFCLLYFGNSLLLGIFNGYGTSSASEAGMDVSIVSKIHSIIENLWYFCYMVCPIVVLIVFSLYQACKQGRIWTLMLGILGILGFSLEFYFSGGQLHYYQYHVPFAILIISELLCIRDVKFLQCCKYVLLGWVLLVTFYKTYNNRVYKQYLKGNQRAVQSAKTETIKEYISVGDKVWIVHGGEYYLYFTLDNLPPNIETIGYSFGPLGLNEEKAFTQAKNADWIIRYSEDYPYESFFTDSLKKYVEQYPTIAIEDSTILLHKMH